MFDLFEPNFNLLLVTLTLSLLCGVLIGLERAGRGKPAGVNTHTLVIGASAVFTYVSANVGATDPSRIAAQIVTGVGFLGAGIILKSESKQVTNLTTAASIWYSAAIGMALGFNLYAAAIAATLYAVISSRIARFHKLRQKERKKKMMSEQKVGKV